MHDDNDVYYYVDTDPISQGKEGDSIKWFLITIGAGGLLAIGAIIIAVIQGLLTGRL